MRPINIQLWQIAMVSVVCATLLLLLVLTNIGSISAYFDYRSTDTALPLSDTPMEGFIKTTNPSPPGRNDLAVGAGGGIQPPGDGAALSAKGDLNYGIVIDAGSTGSRLFVYSWPTHSGNAHDLIKIQPVLNAEGKPIVKKVSPGLSSFADNPHDAIAYLQPLMDTAAIHVPPDKHQMTPFFLMGTAGMRLLPAQ